MIYVRLPAVSDSSKENGRTAYSSRVMTVRVTVAMCHLVLPQSKHSVNTCAQVFWWSRRDLCTVGGERLPLAEWERHLVAVSIRGAIWCCHG